MNILGIGIDVVEIKRIKKILKQNRLFEQRIYDFYIRSKLNKETKKLATNN